MKYYFPIIGPTQRYFDLWGETFNGLDEARDHAGRIVQDLVSDAPDFQDFSICITDESNIEIARIPVHIGSSS
jgi:hypothetical protein